MDQTPYTLLIGSLACRLQVVPICIPELEAVRVAQVLTIAAELGQAYKWALAEPALRAQLAPDTRISLATALRFTASDFLQVGRACSGYHNG